MTSKTSGTLNYETVINIIRAWPADARFTLVQDVLSTLKPEMGTAPQRQSTLARAEGLLATNKPAPSDTDIDSLLDERRRERFGA